VNNDEALFTRLLYFGTVHLNRTEEETWLTPLGLLLDLIECHRQHLGFSKPKSDLTIEDILPYGI
jgi:hypothetical protein